MAVGSTLTIIAALVVLALGTDFISWRTTLLGLVGIVASPIALVLGVMARKGIREGSPRALSSVGVGLGGAGTLLWTLIWFSFFLSTPAELMRNLGFLSAPEPRRYRSTTAVPGEPRLYWEVSGRIAEGGLTLAPVFTRELRRTPDGSGDYRVDVIGPADEILSSQEFALATPLPPPAGGPPTGEFTVYVPKRPGAAGLQLFSPTGQLLGTISLTGSPPSVLILSPQAGEAIEGRIRISWRGADPDGDPLTYRVLYSIDNGLSTERLTEPLTKEEYVLNFNRLPGCDQGCLLEVHTSDGADSAIDRVSGFRVVKSIPETWIILPEDGAVYQEGDLVSLHGASINVEEDLLQESALTWKSDRDGVLGHGYEVQAYDLSEGRHEITLTAVDPQGRRSSDEINVVVDGTWPELELWVVRDAIPSRCVDVTIRAGDEPGGSGLAEVAYTLDGGESWTDVPLEELPFHFVVPKTGDVHIAARATDLAGNQNLDGVPLEIAEPCPRSE